jgi:uncharacterized protein with PIN domain
VSNNESRKRATAERQHQIRSKAFSPKQEGSAPRFVADVMVGRLAKWLRIAGFDVLYSNRFTDEELMALSQQQGRILLSRDTRLLVQKAVRHFIFLEQENIQSQLEQVFRVTRTTTLPGVLTRCLSCNKTLEQVPRDQVRDQVPPFVFETQPHFKRCPSCNKIYWAGTHRQAVIRTLEKLLQNGPQP